MATSDPEQQQEVRPTTFLDVLGAVPQAASIFLSVLRGNIASARLACKPLRKLLDEHVKDIRVLVEPGDLRRWTAGTLPSLARWPSCSTLEITLSFQPLLITSDAFAAIAMLPLAGVPASTRQQVHDLRIFVNSLWKDPDACDSQAGDEPDGSDCLSSEMVLCALVPRLPGLRRLDLGGMGGMLYDPFLQQLMYEALASLPHLEDLVLPSSRALDRIGILSDSPLQRLTVRNLKDPAAAPPSRQALLGLSQLSRLASLELEGVIVNAGWSDAIRHFGFIGHHCIHLPDLLASLPSSVTELSLPRSAPGPDRLSVTLKLSSGGHLQSVSVSSEAPLRLCVASLLAQELLGCRTLDGKVPQLEGCCIESFEVGTDQPSALRPLLELLQRCRRTDVRRLYAGSLRPVLPWLELLGKPQQLVLQTPEGCRCSLTLRAPGQPPIWDDQGHQQQLLQGAQPQGAQQLDQLMLPLPPRLAHGGSGGGGASLQLAHRHSRESSRGGAAESGTAALSSDHVLVRAVQRLMGAGAAGPMGLGTRGSLGGASRGGSLGGSDSIGLLGTRSLGSPSASVSSSARLVPTRSGALGSASGPAPARQGPAQAQAPAEAPADPYASGLLLLQGDPLERLRRSGRPLRPWLEWLQEQIASVSAVDGAGRSTSTGGAAGFPAPATPRLRAFVVLPEPAPAVLLDCGKAYPVAGSNAAAVAAALQSPAVSERVGGGLHVAPVALGPSERPYCPQGLVPRAVFVGAVGKVLQELWDGRWSSGASAALGEKEVLRRMIVVLQLLDKDLEGGAL